MGGREGLLERARLFVAPRRLGWGGELAVFEAAMGVDMSNHGPLYWGFLDMMLI